MRFIFKNDTPKSKIILVTTIAVKKFARMPIPSVIAKPLIGPVPKKYSMSAVIKVVTFASRMVTKAF